MFPLLAAVRPGFQFKSVPFSALACLRAPRMASTRVKAALDLVKDGAQRLAASPLITQRFKKLVMIAGVTALSLIPSHAEVTLAWDPNSEPDLAGYKIYRWRANGDLFVRDVGNVTMTSFVDLTPGETYTFRATAYNTAGLESLFSNAVEWTEPQPTKPAPVGPVRVMP